MNEQLKVPKVYLDFLDQVFEIERKVNALRESNSIGRNVNRIKELFDNIFATPSEFDTGLSYYNPIGETYNETRTDLEASIAGNSTENLVITEVVKPIIRLRKGSITIIARKGVVVAEPKLKEQ